MPALSISVPFPIFNDRDGQPLDNGYVYIGTPYLDPQTNPVQVYWDAALTIPAAQPIRTRSGYPVNSGTPARMYVNGNYSIQVQNKNGSIVYSAPTATDRYNDSVVTDAGYTPSVSSLLTTTTMSGALNQLSDKDQGASFVGYKQSGLNRVATTVKSKLQEVDSIFDFMTAQQISDTRNAVQFDCSAIVESAINTLKSEGKGSLYFPPGTYYYANPVDINFDAQDGFRIYGASLANYMFFDVGGTRFTGAAGMESIFILTKTNLALAGGYSFECSHIYFKSGNNGTAGPLTAIKNKVGGAPARPFIVKNCGFLDFDKAIVSDLIGTGGLQTGICQVIIRENTFCSCAYAVYGTGTGADGTMMDFIFCDNVSENGGSIYVNGLAGTFNISDNILEGQANAIQLTAGLANGQIRRNYFESNSGYLYRFQASNNFSSLSVGDNYIINSTGALVSVFNCNYRCDDNYERAGVIAGMTYTDGKSRISNNGVLRASELSLVSGGSVFLDYTSVPRNTSVYPGTLTSGTYISTGGSPEVTPIGTVDVETVTGNGGLVTPAVTLNSGDWIVLMCLARTRATAAIIYATIFDNAGNPIGNSDTSQTIRNAALGEWVFMLHYVKVSASSAGNVKFRYVTSGGSVDVTKTYVYKVAAPGGSSALYYCLPNP